MTQYSSFPGPIEEQYLSLVETILEKGHFTGGERTGVGTYVLDGNPTIEHDFQEEGGRFPLLTTKKIGPKTAMGETICFVRGYTSKADFQAEKVPVWDEWANPVAVAREWNYVDGQPTVKSVIQVIDRLNRDYSGWQTSPPEHMKDSLARQTSGLQEIINRLDVDPTSNRGAETIVGHDKARTLVHKIAAFHTDDLGPIYGWQWRHSGAQYRGAEHDYTGEGIDQLANAINGIKTNGDSRRLVVTGWNPADANQMALEPCHHYMQFNVIRSNPDRLNLLWVQRSIDTGLGLPFNIAGYALLLQAVAQETGLLPGKLTGQLGNTHIYANQVNGLRTQLERSPRKLPFLHLDGFTDTLSLDRSQIRVEEYDPHPAISLPIAV